MIHLFS